MNIKNMHYINFYFKKLIYDEETIMGVFLSRDDDIICSFSYNRKSRQCDIWGNNKPIEEITPLPVYWLELRLKEKGHLNENESKISY